ncbi:MAG: prolipoprotein diacylglyceryl transferase [Anaerolineaceae bacterium]|nr:prolipoprotein diacylglyceryl transferase [Anaerolineaceae bacterium]
MRPFFVYGYTAVFAAGLLLTWGFTRQQAGRTMLPNWPGDALAWPDAALATLLTGWVGARLGFIWVNWGYFAERPSELMRLWQGGQTAYGALIGGLVGLGLWCWWQKRPFLPSAAFFSPALLLLIITGWAACWVEGCAYGRQTFLGPFSANLPDQYGVFAVRYQTQLLGVGLNLLALAFVLFWQKRWGYGRLFPLTLLLANLIHLGLTLVRADAVPYLAGWRLDTWLALLFAIGGLLLLQYGRRIEQTSGR